MILMISSKMNISMLPKFHNKVRGLMLGFMLALSVLSMVAPFTVAHAATDNGSALCTNQTDVSKNIGTCINRIYVISLAAGGIIAVLIFVIAGYMYMSGDSKTAMTMIKSAITGLIVLFTAFLFLNTINPDLTTFTGLSLPDATCGTGNTLCAAPSTSLLNTGNSVNNPGSGNTSGGSCKVATSGPATPASLQGIFGDYATQASEIAQAESSGNPGASGDTCENGGYNASTGLFQINISANDLPSSVTGGAALACHTAFSNPANAASLDPDTKDYKCSVTNMTLYNQCTTAMEDPVMNAKMAFSLSKGGTNWAPWSTHSACGL